MTLNKRNSQSFALGKRTIDLNTLALLRCRTQGKLTWETLNKFGWDLWISMPVSQGNRSAGESVPQWKVNVGWRRMDQKRGLSDVQCSLYTVCSIGRHNLQWGEEYRISCHTGALSTELSSLRVGNLLMFSKSLSGNSFSNFYFLINSCTYICIHETKYL